MKNEAVKRLARALDAPLNAIIVYECPHCGTEHDFSDDALMCCTEVNEKIKYRCPLCTEAYDTEDEAHACCEDEEE